MDEISAEILRCQDEWYSLLGTLEDLQYCSVALADGNVRRIRLPEEVEPSVLMKEIKSFLRKKKAKLSELYYWAIHPDFKNKKLEDFLISRDFKSNLEIGMVLGPRVSLRIDPDVLIEGGSEMTEEWEQVQKTEYQNDIFVKTPQIPKLMERKKERFKDPRVEIYVAKLRGKPVGKMTLFTSEKTAQIDEVYTLPDYRHKRVSSTLMATLIDISRLRDVNNIIVVVPDTFKSMEMYKKIGFAKKVELPGYYL